IRRRLSLHPDDGTTLWQKSRASARGVGTLRSDVLIERDLPIPMDDGVVLRADVYRPDTDEPAPVVLNHGPYGKGIPFRDGVYAERYERLVTEHPEVLEGTSGEYLTWETVDPERWVPAGYAVVRVDSRGAGRSPGYLDEREDGTGSAFPHRDPADRPEDVFGGVTTLHTGDGESFLLVPIAPPA